MTPAEKFRIYENIEEYTYSSLVTWLGAHDCALVREEEPGVVEMIGEYLLEHLLECPPPLTTRVVTRRPRVESIPLIITPYGVKTRLELTLYTGVKEWVYYYNHLHDTPGYELRYSVREGITLLKSRTPLPAFLIPHKEFYGERTQVLVDMTALRAAIEKNNSPEPEIGQRSIEIT